MQMQTWADEAIPGHSINFDNVNLRFKPFTMKSNNKCFNLNKMDN